MTETVELFKALSDSNRLRIVHLLKNHELCVCELEVILDLSQSNVSRHLSKLRQVDLLKASKDAQWMHYSFQDKFTAEHGELVAYLDRCFENTEIFTEDLKRCEQYVNSHYTCQTITSERDLVIDYLNLYKGE